MRKMLLALSICFLTGSNASSETFVSQEEIERFNSYIKPAKLFIQTHTRFKDVSAEPLYYMVEANTIKQVTDCPSSCAMNPTAYYDDNVKAIYIDKRVLKIPAQYQIGLLIHELIHFYQYKEGQRNHKCEDRERLETEAIMAQMIYLRRFGIRIAKHISFECAGITKLVGMKW